jgi:hypothetical protein
MGSGGLRSHWTRDREIDPTWGVEFAAAAPLALAVPGLGPPLRLAFGNPLP